MRIRRPVAACVLAIFCLSAFPLAAKTPPPKTKPKPRPVLRGDYAVIADMAGGLLKSVAGSALKELLFPSKTIDIDKLLSDISANVRKELIKNVVDGDETTLTAATTSLKDYQTEWKNGGDPVSIESRLSSDSTINGVNTVIARTGAAGKAEYVDPGLPLFVAAAQIKANRLELRRKLTPANDAAIRAVLITHLEDSLSHARKTMNRRRTESMNARLGRISECFLGSKDSHGLPWNLIWTYKTYFTDSADSTQFKGGSQADDDEPKAFARCEGRREPYVDAVRKKTAATVDANWTSTDAILDTWAQTLDALKNSPPGTTARATRIDFGGMFGIGERSFNNPLTSGQSCPAGYTPYEFKGTFNVDWQAFYCGRITGDGEPAADFGGMYGSANHNDTGAYWINNPITGGTSCPSGFTAAEVNNQHKLFYCWKQHVAGTKPAYLFGGIYSDNGEKKIPITDATICPNGYTPSLVHGTRGASGVPSTRRSILCWSKPAS
ncbi:MAG: hypothetical protein JWO97_560 [Acidobacteria bacterium]|nr:hypothetical protein [Acidobacteriota bacterium]